MSKVQAEIDAIIEEEWMRTMDCVEKLRTKYPDDVYKKTVLDIVLDKADRYEKFIREKREKYYSISSFIEKQFYYNNDLKLCEEGYKKNIERINRYLKSPEPRPYEEWVNTLVYQFMKTDGYKRTVEFYIDLGEILQ